LELNKLQKTFFPLTHSPHSKPVATPTSEIAGLNLGETYTSTERSHRQSVSLVLPSSDLPPEFEFELFVPVEEIQSLDDGIEAHRNGEKQKAWDCFEAHAKLDNPQAIYWKGYYLWEGYVVAKNRSEAAQLFKKAADEGIADAQLRYAFCMVHSEGIKFDKQEFMRYLILSADNGNPSARYNLADVYLNGKLGVPKDEKEGVKYLRLAALKNQPKAQEMLKALKEKGVDVGDLNEL
jgi:TPR repeat protein